MTTPTKTKISAVTTRPGRTIAMAFIQIVFGSIVAMQSLASLASVSPAHSATRNSACMASCRSTANLASDDWPTHTGERPAVVYRVDTRSPAEIFVFGFSAGTGMNLVNHVLAANEIDAASAFVATTDDPSVASLIAIHYRHRNFPVWIYEIRADGGFYSVAPSLRWIIDNEPDEAERAAWALETLGFQREWVAISRIPRENIRRAYRVDRDLDASDFRDQISDIDSNSLYVDGETRASDQIITS